MTATQSPAVVPADPATAGLTSGQGPLPGGGEAVTGADTQGEGVNAAVTALPVARAPSPIVEFTVYGKPVPQGSIRSLGAGRPSVHANATVLRPWRAEVAHEARAAMRGRGPFTGPVSLSACFTLRRPKSAPRARRFPAGRPDVDKLARALLDACTEAGVFLDDAQVVRLIVAKVYTGDRLALDDHGVEVMVRAVL